MSTVRHVGKSDPAWPFPPLERRSIAVNTANRQLAVGDDAGGVATGTPLPLIAVRFFDARAQYALGDFVVNAGAVWVAGGTIPPGPFSSAQWVQVTGDIETFVLRTGDTMTGALTISPATGGANISLDPLQATQQASLIFSQSGAAKWQIGKQTTGDFFLYNVVGGNIAFNASFATGLITVAADPTADLGIATKQLVDARVKLNGDTMSGDLTISKATPLVVLNSSNGIAGITAQKAGLALWNLLLSDGSTSFSINRHNDAGAFVDTPLSVNRYTGQTTFSGNVSVQKTAPILYLNGTPGQPNALSGLINSVPRWSMQLGDGATEGGGGFGSNFRVWRYNDAGAAIDAPLTIDRQSGQVTIGQTPTADFSAATKGYVDGKVATGIFPVGTRLVFVQPAAPTGWVQVTGWNDLALRIVGGASGGTTGGAQYFSTIFGYRQTDGFTLAINEMPYHNHPTNTGTGSYPYEAGGAGEGLANGSYQCGFTTPSFVGGSQPHTHLFDMRLGYVDATVCQKT